MPDSLIPHLAAAFDARAALFATLHAEQTDSYRLFHGDAEGCPGLCIDRYGDLLLVQCFHSPPGSDTLAAIDAFYAARLPGLFTVFNDRSHVNARIGNPLPAEQLALAMQPRDAHERGMTFLVQGRHDGQDPWLLLDRRAARRRIAQEVPGKSLLNLFAYTCSAGIAAVKAGARFVLNVDVAESHLSVGKANARRNDLPLRPRFIKSDAFAAMRQLSGLGQAERVRGKRMPPFPKMEAQQFDLVFLDPPPHAKSPFGIVDLATDYPSVFKPALLCVAPGGSLICTHNLSDAAQAAWLDQLQRSAAKAGRPVREAEWIATDADFPVREGQSSLKTLLLRV